MDSWEDLHPTWARPLWSIARQAAGPVRHLYDDLYQVGWATLLERTDPDHPHHVPITETELLKRIVHDAMKNHRVLWLSGNTGRHPRTQGERVLSIPAEEILRDKPAPRRVEMGSEGRGRTIREWLPPRTRDLFEKKARGEKLTNAESQNLSKGRRQLAARVEVTRPPATCADCAGHPEYLGDDNVWRCYLHRTLPTILWNHPEERTVWSAPKLDTDAPAFHDYRRTSTRPTYSEEYAAWRADFMRKPKDERDLAVAAWVRKRR